MSSSQPLFYQSVVPLDTSKHASLRLSRPEKPLEFARSANLIPALVDEFEVALSELPVAFLPGVEFPSAVFVTGAAPGKNAFIGSDGLWNGAYVPAYLRRYPFIIGDMEGSDSVLCIDEKYAGLVQEGGERLFSDGGEREPALEQALGLAQSYRDAAVRTETFCRMLHDYGLLQPATLDTTAPDGTKSVVYGLMVVDENALNAISTERLKALHDAGFLKAIYNQIASLRTVDKLNPALAETDESMTKKSA